MLLDYKVFGVMRIKWWKEKAFIMLSDHNNINDIIYMLH